MRKAARFVGVIWMVGMALAGLVLMGSGLFHGSNRGVIYLTFGAALPGLLIYRWGDGTEANKAKLAERRRKPKPPIDAAAEAGHVLQLETDPLLEADPIEALKKSADKEKKTSTLSN